MNTTHKNILAALSGRASRIVGNNTKAIRHESGAVSIRFHSTDILTALPDGSVTVNSGGFRTATTKDRLNSWLADGYFIAQERGCWYWHRRQECAGCGGAGQVVNSYTERDCEVCGGAKVTTYNFRPVFFSDGDTIGPRGALKSKASAGAESRAAKLAKEINAYAHKCAAAVPMPAPSSGDCWYCSMIAQNAQSKLPRSVPVFSSAKPAPVTLGDASGNTEHLLSHMAEGYVVPSLVMHALREAGCGDLILGGAFGQAGEWGNQVAPDYVRRAVRRYMKRRLSLAGN